MRIDICIYSHFFRNFGVDKDNIIQAIFIMRERRSFAELQKLIDEAIKNNEPYKRYVKEQIELLKIADYEFIEQARKEGYDVVHDPKVGEIRVRQYAAMKQLAMKIGLPVERYDEEIKKIQIGVFGEENYKRFFGDPTDNDDTTDKTGKSDICEELKSHKKPRQIMAWLGFGFSLCVAVIILGILALVFSPFGSRNVMGVAPFYILVCVPLGLMAMIFSIIGLRSARKHSLKKWPGICGIIFSFIILIGFFVPMIASASGQNEPIAVEIPEVKEEVAPQQGVVLSITDHLDMLCYDNRNGEDNSPAKIFIHGLDLKHEFETWMRMNNISKEDFFMIRTNAEADYTEVVAVIDVLNELGIKNFQLMTSLRDDDSDTEI